MRNSIHKGAISYFIIFGVIFKVSFFEYLFVSGSDRKRVTKVIAKTFIVKFFSKNPCKSAFFKRKIKKRASRTKIVFKFVTSCKK